jgi:hypothetical protein
MFATTQTKKRQPRSVQTLLFPPGRQFAVSCAVDNRGGPANIERPGIFASRQAGVKPNNWPVPLESG